MNEQETQQLIRDSIQTHLGLLQSFGVGSFLHRHADLPSESIATTPSEPTQETSAPTPQQDSNNHADILQAQSLEQMSALLTDCQRCRLCEKRQNLVFGEGNPNADLMFIGEGPGADEDAQGRPFVGRAGQLLDKIIQAMGYAREEVYIANVVKCRPPGNRNPELDEIAMCMPFLKKQISLVQPKMIMCLGKFAAQTVLDSQMPISRLRGNFYEFEGIPVMPTFHPAFLLRNPNMKRPMWEDCKQVMEKLK
ncbi:MAG: uracil-DNA glycosylase [Deltaproteobacteria bacterium]|nr:uracil-DNA glycosylase [Deltaproteobacteria bacterium]